ncbi:MAG TPA: type IX secretion system protein PorQ [Saprospiraceae bacterium]|nr:type IX secretion system protein PorQ [Saprospiraceae bacterium]HMQ83697.1 type IX secretion system protein PorQ [Saprospiraceae bacterium]
MKIKLLALALFLVVTWKAHGQLGGLNTFEFLNTSASARISALGGNLITVRDDDVNLALTNPAALNAAMHQQLAFSHGFHVAGIAQGFAAYGHHWSKPALTTYAGVQYVSYGEFEAMDELGTAEGTFKAAEYAVNVGAGKQLAERLAIGANARFITSQLESYRSSGLALDVAGMYFDTASRFTLTFVIKNIGTQLSTYREGNQEPLPYEMQIGISKQLKYLPFRFSIIYHHLDRWNILYDDPNAEPSTLFFGDTPTERSASSIWMDNFFRHFIFNGEFLMGAAENFRLRLGYNHFMRKELIVDGFGGLAGFSVGLGIKVNRFRIDYGLRSFHTGGALNHFSLSTNLSEFKRTSTNFD